MALDEKLSNTEYETSLISCLFKKPELIVDCGVETTDFYKVANQELFEVIYQLFKQGKDINHESIFQQLRTHKDFYEMFMGVGTLVTLLEREPYSNKKRVEELAVVVKGYSKARQALQIYRDAAVNLPNIQPEDIAVELQKAGQQLVALSTDAKLDEQSITKEAIFDAVDELLSGIKVGLQTGLKDLDTIIKAGFQPGDLIVLAARPSMGKTALALNIATHVIDQGKHVLVFSMETKIKAILMRIIQGRAGVERKMEGLDDEAGKRLMNVSEVLMPKIESNLFLLEGGCNNADDIIAQAKKNVMQHGPLSLIIIDHLQLVRARGFAKDNARGIISYATGLFKQLAVELNVPVLCLSQLNRNVEDRDNKRPRLSDLKESGSIEQDADIVMTLYRHEYYYPNEDKNHAEIAVQKQRDGAVGRAVLMYLPQFMRFCDAPAEWVMNLGEEVKEIAR